MTTRTVSLIHTGGTLGMGPGEDDSLAPGPSLDRILDQVPELRELADLRMAVAFNQDSATTEPEDILLLARLIRHEAASCDGIVLIHGTDTMAYTASVLGFLLADLGRPVVLTGSQRPLAYVRSDARGNLVDAVTLAARGVDEVGICFGDHWLRGVAADKVSVHRYEAFESPNLPPLAELGLHVQVHPHAGAFPRQVPPGIGPALESAIEIYAPFPGMPWRLPDRSCRGVLIRAFGAGNLPMDRPDLRDLFRHCEALDLPVVIISQCASGGVDLATYDLGRRAQAMGAISGGRHTPWAALAKLSLALGAGFTTDEIRRAFQVSWAGEPV
ncbi:asparaginase [Mesoterricola silvestris]|uniref:L-asparaginase 1 n=1 Tax=Mesoterricola silvestris TaxID=2927979 RepID=A0AA48GQS3_9BACT|nr:asparaginase [Mesoterricola silvestris]BDU74399.1 L-asparaginase 1 [Mesoterricola silvestris]